MKCANCDKNAEYTDATPGVNAVDYCLGCLPASLRVAASQGKLPLNKPVVVKEIGDKVDKLKA